MRLSTTVLFAALAASAPAFADDPAPTPAPSAAPTPEQLAEAKKAFEEGNALFKAGKLDEAVVKLKESYRLSKNAFLLYNIGQTYDLLDKKDMVLFYYRKFLASAPPTAPMRASVEKRVAALEAENVQAATPEGETAGNDATTVAPPTSKFGPADFKHETIDTAPPGWPIDIAAQLPPESGFTVKLFYRASGDAAFVTKPMTWRNYELVARIPGTKATGKWVQYYIEVRDAAGKLITRSGKSTSPNLVNIEANAKKQYYADYVDEGGEVVAPAPIPAELNVGSTGEANEGKPSTTIRTLKWVTSGVAVGLFGTSLVGYKLAGDQHDKLLSDSRMCGTPPCQVFDESFGQRVQTLGKRYDTLYKVTLGVGIATAGVAAYLWYRDAKQHKHASATQSDTPTAWLVAPTIGEHFAGATAAAEF